MGKIKNAVKGIFTPLLLIFNSNTDTYQPGNEATIADDCGLSKADFKEIDYAFKVASKNNETLAKDIEVKKVIKESFEAQPNPKSTVQDIPNQKVRKINKDIEDRDR